MRAALPSSAPSRPEPGPAAVGGGPGPTGAGVAGRAGPEAARGRRELALALVAALVPLALYARSLGWPALALGDHEIRTADTLAEAARAAGLGGVSLHLEGLGRSALVARGVSLVLVSGASALAFALARALGLGRTASLAAALCFALHPLQVESVAWLSQRGTLLGGFFFLLAARLSLERGARSTAIGLALLPALLAEPRLAAGVPWLWLAEYGVLGRRPEAARIALGSALMALAAGVLLDGRLGPAVPEGSASVARLAQLPRALTELLAHAFVPTGLTPRHGLPLDAPWPATLAWPAFALVLLALAVGLARRPRVGLAGLLFLLLAGAQVLLPRSADLWRESDGFLALFGLALALVASAPRGLAARPGIALCGGVLCALAVGSGLRLGAWSSEPRLQASAAAARPDDLRAWLALGDWNLAHGRIGAAQVALEQALARHPDDASALALRGEIELRQAGVPGREARLDAARAFLERGRAHARVAELAQLAGDARTARAELEAALAESPLQAGLHGRLGRTLLELDEPAAARAAFERARELDPRSSEPWSGLGRLHFGRGEAELAARAFERALELEPDLVEANALLGHLLEARGERAAAEQHYRRALSIAPDRPDGLYVDTLYALGALLAASERADEALRCMERVVALRADPPHVRAHLESARLLLARGETALARARLEAVLRFNPAHAEARAQLERLVQDGPGR